jgi:hypothetical protein
METCPERAKKVANKAAKKAEGKVSKDLEKPPKVEDASFILGPEGPETSSAPPSCVLWKSDTPSIPNFLIFLTRTRILRNL